MVNPHEVADRPLLPSFLFLPGELDFPEGSTALPWAAAPDGVVGELARTRGAENPSRLVASAKSWLSTPAADRTGPILPWGSPDEVPRVSPVEASARFLAHLREAWNHAHGDAARFDAQDLLITVPASFDEEARLLTLRAADAAGLGEVTLLEEPQAAFYAWLGAEGDLWRRRVRVGDLVLVCDVGGGTTDFSLIAVGERDGDLSLERVAVGDHILLGGDNMDLALARLLQERLEQDGHRVDTWQLQALWHQARAAKEALFGAGEQASAEHPITLLGRGRRVVGGAITTSLSTADLRRIIVDGFFPDVPRDAKPARGRRVGFQELGLPYAADAAITRHLAAFLARQGAPASGSAPVRRGPSGMACPTHVLFNGGVFKAGVLRDRVIAVLSAWLTAEGFPRLDAAHVLAAPDLDHAVARGAAYYGRARHGRGVRIRSAAARSYYVGIESAMPSVPGLAAPLKALCVVPFGMEEGTSETHPRARIRSRRRRAGRVPVPHLDGETDGCRGRAHRRLGRRHRGARSARSHAPHRGQRRRRRTRDARVTPHGARDARALVRFAGRPRALEAGAEREGPGRIGASDDFQMPSPAFLVGIDLGTTNCALAYVDARGGRTFDEARAVRFPVPQLVAPREVQPHPVLPAFLYLGTEHDRASGMLDVPWDSSGPADAVGVFAREHGALAPDRLVSSAKSWLAHGDVDRTAPLLPFGREAADPGISPLEVSARYLAHLRDAWNHFMARSDPALRLEAQHVVLTVPASFDDEARELTAEAAARAGLARVVLLEEPIAALYAWLTRARTRTRIAPGALVLVCDVGGGTTDFSLIRAGARGDGSGFERIAIGEHLLLGGDNLDFALASMAEERLDGPRLSLGRREALRRQASAAKELLLSDARPDAVTLTVLGGGRSVVGGAAAVTLTRADVVGRLLDGFLPLVSPDDRPPRERRRGLRELGLPYESEPAITRHLAAFLAQGGSVLQRPDAILFNGGFFAPSLARQRLVDVLASWFGEAPTVLATDEPDAAVAFGAAAHAALRRLPNAPADLLVRAGSPRTYYVELSSGDAHADAGRVRALAVMARGTDEGTRLDLHRRLRVQTNRPVAFTLWSSTTRVDEAGTLVEEDAVALHRHAPLAAVLRYGKRSAQPEVDVALSVQFTEVGTLELWLNAPSTGHRWRLQFQARGMPAAAEDVDHRGRDEVVIPDEALETAVALLRATFSGDDGPSPATVTAALEERLGFSRHAWPLDVLRRLADALLDVVAGRTRSAAHETRWLNLAGFCVRPGFGAAADAWRIGELRKVYTAGLSFPKEIQGQVEWLVLWQRAAGGFSAGQQQELARRLVASLGIGARKPPRLNAQIERESWRLIASLERVDTGTRVRAGDAIAAHLARDPRNASLAWALGRVGARVPFYGPLDRVVAPADAERWLAALVAPPSGTPDHAVAIAQVAALTGDPSRDLSQEAREMALARLDALAASDTLREQLRRVTAADRAGQASRYFGEALPSGLTLAE